MLRRLIVATTAVVGVMSFTTVASANTALPDRPASAPAADQHPVARPTAVRPFNTFYLTNGDYVHITTDDASGHGWWEKLSGTATTAKVTIWLEENLGGTWYIEATGTYTGGPGPGSGKWANARYTCIPTSSLYQWRSRIDVDIIGEQDPPDQAITKTQSLHCL